MVSLTLEVIRFARAPLSFVFELIVKVVFEYFTLIAHNFPHFVTLCEASWMFTLVLTLLSVSD